MKIIFGLGNPGSRYAATRHNCGFLTLERMAERLGCQGWKKEQENEISSAIYRGEKLVLARPQSFMNLSGFPLVRLTSFFKVSYAEILVIHDDLDLQPGSIRLRRGGSSGGHNGIKSIQEQTGTQEINRLKIGIGPAPFGDTVAHVLAPFSAEELPLMHAALDRAAEAALCWAVEGISRAMNLYNHNEAQ